MIGTGVLRTTSDSEAVGKLSEKDKTFNTRVTVTTAQTKVKYVMQSHIGLST